LAIPHIYQTYENRSTAPHKTYGKITEEVRDAVLEKRHKNPRLGSWRLSLFEYEGIGISHESIWLILMKARHTKLPAKYLYHLTHPHQIWFIDHMHLRTLPNDQKVYSLIVLDGFTRFMLTDEICLSKTARDACLILLRAYFYPHIQRQKTVAGIQKVYTDKTNYYNHRVHWEFRKDEVKTPIGKLGDIKGRPMPEDFELKYLATGKRFKRTVDGQG